MNEKDVLPEDDSDEKAAEAGLSEKPDWVPEDHPEAQEPVELEDDEDGGNDG